MTSQTGTELRMERSLKARPEAVYAALTSREAIGRWFGPSDDFDVTVHEWDCQLGGRYRVEFNTPTGETHTIVGEFKAIVPNRRVADTWSWEGQPPMDTLVTFQIEGAGDRTNLLFTHEGFPSEDVRDHHETGWMGSMLRLEREVGG